MSKTIKYLRISTGDELISEVVVRPETIVLRNPMILEYIEMTTGANHPFMTRFNPYSIDGSATIDRNHVVFMTDTSPEMLTYYATSVDYAEKTCDKLVTDRVIEADQFIVAADTPESPVTTTPPATSQENNPNVFPLNMKHMH